MKLEEIIEYAVCKELSINIFLNDICIPVNAPDFKTYIRMLRIMGIGLLDSLEGRLDVIKSDKGVLCRVLDLLTEKGKGFFDDCELEDLQIAFSEVLHMVYASDFFAQMPKRKSTNSKSKVIGGKTILGQISNIIEDLNLSYNEAMDMPYPLLLMLQYDKIRPDYDSKDKPEVTYLSGKEMMKRKVGYREVSDEEMSKYF